MGGIAHLGCRVRADRSRVPRGGGPLKLLDVTEFHSALGGGIRTYLEAKRTHLRNHPDIEHVLVVTGPADRDGTGPDRTHVVRGPPIPGSPGYHAMLRAGRVRDIIRRERPDVVELGSHFAAPWIALPAAREVGAAVVGFYHTDLDGVLGAHAFRHAPAAVQRAARGLTRRVVRAVYGRCDLLIASTERAAAAVRRIPGARVEVVPLGVDTGLFHPSRRRAALRAALGGDAGRPLLLYVGRLAREKELEVLLQALPAIHRAIGARCVLVGEGHLRHRLRAVARAHPQWLAVRPYERDRTLLATLYASVDAYVAPGPYETFGLAVAEAMASGLPVAGVDSGALAERLGGQPWARTFRPRDPGDLARAVVELLNARRAPDPEARAVAERFSWERTVDRLADLYRSLPSGTSNRAPRAKTPVNTVSSAPGT